MSQLTRFEATIYAVNIWRTVPYKENNSQKPLGISNDPSQGHDEDLIEDEESEY